MAINDVVFVKGKGGLGRALPGSDYISGILFYSNSYPSGFDVNNQTKQVFSVEGAETLGILDDYSDETPATATIEVTNVGSNGDTVEIILDIPLKNGGTEEVNFGTYTKVSGDTTVDDVADAINTLINAGTLTHGFSSTVLTDTVTITAREGLGVALNTGTLLVATDTGTIATTVTQFTGGVASKLAVMHYHISEYFRINPKGNLYVGVFPVPVSTYDFEEILTMQNYANGAMRQVAVYKDAATTASGIVTDTTALQAVAETLEGLHMPISVLYAANIKAISDISTLENLSTATNENVSVTISQDGGGQGADLYVTSGKSITNIGALLGTVSKSSVSDSIAWIELYDVSNGTECEVAAFANGDLYTSYSQSLLNTLNSYRYIFLTKRVGLNGTWWNDSHTAVTQSSDYAYIENVRTIDKAIRGIYSGLLPKLNSPLVLNSDGTMTDNTIAILTAAARPNLDQMVRDTELSAYAITIDPDQDVLTTSELVIAVQLVGIGVARNITVNIGYTISI
jgi:hypothetical protein